MKMRMVWMIAVALLGMNAAAITLFVSPNMTLVFQEMAAALMELWQDGADEDDDDDEEDGEEARQAYVAQPIPCGKDAPTFLAYRAQVFDPFAREQFGLTKDTDKRVSDFLEEQFQFLQRGRLAGWWFVWQEAARLAQEGCTHPVLDWMLAMDAIVNAKDSGKALELLKGLEGKAEGLPNKAFLRLLAAYGTQRAKPSQENEKALCEVAVAWLKEVLQNPKHSRCARDVLGNFIDLERSEVFQSHLPQIEAVDRWFFLLVRGEYAVKKAWEVRGSGGGGEVTPEGWKGFAGWLKAARADLEEAWQLRPELPDAAARLVTVNGGLVSTRGVKELDDLRIWFDRAVAAECDHPEAYSRYLWFARPRWQGSIREMRAFAEECYNTKRFDTFAPYYYVRSLLTVSEEQYGRWQDVFIEDCVFEKSREVLNAILKMEGLSKEERNMYSCVLTMICWAAGDLDAAIEAYKVRQDRHSTQATLFGEASFYSVTRMLDVLIRDPPAELTELARRCLKREFDKTQDLMEALQKEDVWNDSDNYSVIIPLFLMVNSRNADWEKGLWRDLQVSDRFDGWVNRDPKFSVKEQAYVAGAQLARLSLGVPLPENLEIECKVTFEAGAGNASFAIVLDDPTLTQQRAPIVQLTRRDGRGVTASIGSEAQSVMWWDGEKTAVVNIVSKDNQISLSVNGAMVFNNQNMTRAFRPSNRDKTRGLQVRGQRCSVEGMKVRKPQVIAVPFF